MMNPTPQGQCTKSRSVAAVLLTLFFLGGCGMFSRQVQVMDALQNASFFATTGNSAPLLTLRGREPLVLATWEAALRQAKTEQERLRILDRALTYLPAHPGLSIARIEVLAASQQHQAVLDEAHRFLSTQPPAYFQRITRQIILTSLLAIGEIEKAYEQTQLLGPIIEDLPPPELMPLSAALVIIALAQSEAGDEERADATCDQALDRGEGVIDGLVNMLRVFPEKAAKARDLIERALARHPNNPDLYVYLTMDAIARDDIASASQHHRSIPTPLPPRLSRPVDILNVQLAIHEDRPEEALKYLLPRLTHQPKDRDLLLLLMECWRKHGAPPTPEVLGILQLAQTGNISEQAASFLATLVEEVSSTLSPAQTP